MVVKYILVILQYVEVAHKELVELLLVKCDFYVKVWNFYSNS